MSELRISAVVTAHDRRTFLPAAVRSALVAGADEVLVVRNYSGPLEGVEGQYRDVPCSAVETNSKEAAGVDAAQGEIVAFLDDDDLWEPTKGSALRSWFGQSPGLAYANHGFAPIDARGDPVRATHPEFAQRDPSRFASWDRSDFGALISHIWPGNNSSTAVRRDWARDWLVPFREAGWGADLFWLTVAVTSGAEVRIDPAVLTRLRLHDRNMSHPRGYGPEEFRVHHRTSSERFARSTTVLARIAAEKTGPASSASRWLDRKSATFRFLAELEADVRPRRSAATLLRVGTTPDDRRIRQVALATLVSPALARRALYRSSLRRWELGR